MKNGFRNWSDIRVFLAVLREGSTLAASRKLGLAQPTVARRIDALEHELGLALFDRDTRGFRPTAAAKALAARAEAMEQAATALADEVTALSAPRSIRITAFSANFSPRTTQIFSDFSALRPDIRFEFLPCVKVLDLMAGEADIALRITREAPDPDLICRHISTARYALYGSKDYADRQGLPRSVDDLGGHRFVTFQRPDTPPRLDDWLAAHVAPEQVVMSFAEIDLMDAAIVAGRGLGLMNLRMAERHPTLIRCFDPIEELSSRHLLLVSPEAWRREEVRAFTRFFAPRYAAIFR